MAEAINDPAMVVVFKNLPQRNESKTKLEGRPMFDDLEVVELRHAADRQSIKVFPAHEVYEVSPEGESITYAMRYPDHYKRFKSGKAQEMAGTPLAEAPFLTEARRSELKALSIYTVEALASLDGQSLKNLGIGGREMKNQAQAYIDNASGSANVVRMASENEWMKQRIKELEDQNQTLRPAAAPSVGFADTPDAPDFDAMTVEELKEHIEDRTGARPRGNPSKETLVSAAREASAP